MDRSVSNSQVAPIHNFDIIKDSMLPSSELPLTEVLDGNPWEDIFVAHHNSHNRCHPSTAKGATYKSHPPEVWASRPQNGAIHPLKPDAETCHPPFAHQ